MFRYVDRDFGERGLSRASVTGRPPSIFTDGSWDVLPVAGIGMSPATPIARTRRESSAARTKDGIRTQKGQLIPWRKSYCSAKGERRALRIRAWGYRSQNVAGGIPPGLQAVRQAAGTSPGPTDGRSDRPRAIRNG